MCRARLTLAAARFPIPATMPLNPPPRNLRDLLRAEPRLDPSRVQRILAELSAVLAPRHARGEAHGAITPEYVRFDAAGRAILAAPPEDDGRSPAPWPAYLAPEQIDGRPADARSDVYALGLLGWEMLAGQAPWAGESLYSVVLKQREQDLPRLSTLRTGLPRGLVRAIEGALHKHPGDRWQGAPEVLVQLRDDDAPPASGSADAVATTPAGVTAELPVLEPPRVEPRVAPRRVVAPEASPTVPTRPVVPPAPARAGADALEPVARPSRFRPLALAALAIAVLGAGAAGVAVMQGRQESTTTKAWLDSVAGGASGEVVAESTLTAPLRRALAEARRDSLQRRARLLAAARRDSVRQADSAARVAADSAAAAAAPPADSTAPPDTIAPPPPDTVLRTASRSAPGDGACAASDAGSQRRCLLTLLERGDAPLTRAYAARIAELRRAAGTAPGAPDPPAVESLRAEQRAWLAQRDTECRRRGEGREGALWAPERARCLVALGQQRASALDS
jgi:uncharacterized protein YecT (DUF1311 family)